MVSQIDVAAKVEGSIMRLETFAFILFIATAAVSCSKNNDHIKESIKFRNSSQDELVNRQTNNNDEFALNNSEMYNINHNNNPLGSVIIISNSSTVVVSSENSNISENKSYDHNELTYSDALPSTYRRLPHHQRAIAAVAEKRGLLKSSDGERILRRGKRYLQFAKGSRVSVSN